MKVAAPRADSPDRRLALQDDTLRRKRGSGFGTDDIKGFGYG